VTRMFAGIPCKLSSGVVGIGRLGGSVGRIWVLRGDDGCRRMFQDTSNL
jgi:hypothetical protein